MNIGDNIRHVIGGDNNTVGQTALGAPEMRKDLINVLESCGFDTGGHRLS